MCTVIFPFCSAVVNVAKRNARTTQTLPFAFPIQWIELWAKTYRYGRDTCMHVMSCRTYTHALFMFVRILFAILLFPILKPVKRKAIRWNGNAQCNTEKAIGQCILVISMPLHTYDNFLSHSALLCHTHKSVKRNSAPTHTHSLTHVTSIWVFPSK